MNKAKCPMCSADVTIAKTAKLGTLVTCGECEAELEIVSLKPLELDWPLDDLEEDEDDFEEFDLEEDDEFEDLEDLDDDLDDFEDEEDDDDDDDY